MPRRIGFLSGLIIGVLLGAGLLASVVALGLSHLPSWLVVKQNPEQVDAIVVLGGGGGSRLRHAVQLYDSNVSNLLILVGEEEGDWQNILQRHCRECSLETRKHVVINGSLNTMTDAELVRNYINPQKLRSLLVVTDPYHTRRADRIFRKALSRLDVAVFTASSGFYGSLIAPDGNWWQDRRTLELVWSELGKIIYFELAPFLEWYKDA